MNRSPQKGRDDLAVSARAFVNARVRRLQNLEYNPGDFAMELVRGLAEHFRAARGCVLTVGNYDGVHLGHQQMIAGGEAARRRVGCRRRCWCSSRAPRNSSTRRARRRGLTRWREKFLALAALGRRPPGDAALRRAHARDEPGGLRRRADRRGVWVRATWWWAMIFATAAKAGGTIESLRARGRAQGLRRGADRAVHPRRACA